MLSIGLYTETLVLKLCELSYFFHSLFKINKMILGKTTYNESDDETTVVLFSDGLIFLEPIINA